MKINKLLSIVIVFLLFFGFKISYAQEEEPKEPEEMTTEQWETQINEFTAKKTELTKKIEDMQKEKAELLAKVEAKKGEIKTAEDAYWEAVGGKDSYNSFKSNLDKIEKLCKNKEGSKDEINKMFEELSKSGLKCHPDFTSKYRNVKDCIANWKDLSVPEYTVLKGDYLFIIAAKKEVYNNHHMWPIIWEANEMGVISAPGRIPKTIRNPHLIYPGQVLKIPQMSDALKKSGVFERAKSYFEYNGIKKRHHKKINTDNKDIKKDVKKDEKKDVKKEPKK